MDNLQQNKDHLYKILDSIRNYIEEANCISSDSDINFEAGVDEYSLFGKRMCKSNGEMKIKFNIEVSKEVIK